MESDNSEVIAKTTGNSTTNRPTLPESNCEGDTSGETNCEPTEGMPSDMTQGGPMQGGGMDGGFPGNMGTSTVADSGNQWAVAMTATGIITGAIIISAVAICLTIWFSRKK